MTILSARDVFNVWVRQGGLKSRGVEFTAIATAESGRNTVAVSPVGALGLWQIMPFNFGAVGLDESYWRNADTNARAAVLLSGKGNNCAPWDTCYADIQKSGRYAYLDWPELGSAAQSLIQDIVSELGSNPGQGGPPGQHTSLPTTAQGAQAALQETIRILDHDLGNYRNRFNKVLAAQKAVTRRRVFLGVNWLKTVFHWETLPWRLLFGAITGPVADAVTKLRQYIAVINTMIYRVIISTILPIAVALIGIMGDLIDSVIADWLLARWIRDQLQAARRWTVRLVHQAVTRAESRLNRRINVSVRILTRHIMAIDMRITRLRSWTIKYIAKVSRADRQYAHKQAQAVLGTVNSQAAAGYKQAEAARKSIIIRVLDLVSLHTPVVKDLVKQLVSAIIDFIDLDEPELAPVINFLLGKILSKIVDKSLASLLNDVVEPLIGESQPKTLQAVLSDLESQYVALQNLWDRLTDQEFVPLEPMAETAKVMESPLFLAMLVAYISDMAANPVTAARDTYDVLSPVTDAAYAAVNALLKLL